MIEVASLRSKHIRHSDLPELWGALGRLDLLWLPLLDPDGGFRTDIDVDEAQHVAMEEERLLSSMTSKIVWHALPVSLVGFDAADLSRKTAAILHSLRLECATNLDLATYLRNVTCIMSDFGTEYGLGCSGLSWAT